MMKRSLLVALVVLLAVIIAWPTRRRALESFANEILNPIGDSFVDDACSVSDDASGRYILRGNPYLTKNPSGANSCLFKQTEYDDTVMDKDLTQCTSSAPFLTDSTAVSNVSVQQVSGVSRCVVDLTPGNSAATYSAYEIRSREETIKLTRLYLELKAKYDALMVKYLALQDAVGKLRAQLKKVQDMRADVQSKMAAAVADTESAMAENAAKVQQRSLVVARAAGAKAQLDKCTAANSGYVKKPYTEWSDGDRNTAIWLVSHFTGRDGGWMQGRPNSVIGGLIQPVCGVDPCTAANPNYVDKPYGDWSDGDRNTAIWLVNNLTGTDTGWLQSKTNEFISKLVKPVCAGLDKCTAANEGYVKKSYTDWSDGDRNTAIWLVAYFTGEDGLQAQDNATIGRKLQAVCG